MSNNFPNEAPKENTLFIFHDFNNHSTYFILYIKHTSGGPLINNKVGGNGKNISQHTLPIAQTRFLCEIGHKSYQSFEVCHINLIQ